MANVNIAELVAESRAAQGLPPKVTDPAVIARVASLFAAADQAGAVASQLATGKAVAA